MWRNFILLYFTFYILHSTFGQIVRPQVFAFLNLPSNAQTSALGGLTTSAHQGDVNSLWASPALSDSSYKNQVALSVSPYLATTKLISMAYCLPFKSKGTWAVGVQYLNYGTMPQTDASGNEIGTFTAADYALAGSYARTEGYFTLGTNLKLVGSGIETYQSLAVMADVGGVFKHPKKDLTIGLSVKNIGLAMKSYFSNGQLDTPFDVQLGLTLKPEFMPFRFSLTAHHLYQWDIVYNDPALNLGYDANGNKITKKITTVEKVARHLVLGVEVLTHKNLKIILGYNHLRRQELRLLNVSSFAGLSGGLMWRNQKFNFGYAYSSYHLSGGLHTLSLGVKVGK